ncbi:NAD(P)H-dependent glycerol-3-phosphate dehydrogenase [Sphingosinicella sp. LHD-64]|uniref:NAD(P)H-dependent glycerol-3-phosphate dehydrogenase n=1 Tax=Sphingosinicella sp. LHD-64 TaxID=3072139 RepID=UPI00280D3820|nr:NAD(P)H-dependent glycerol-3-phosphate dehydrogenase [Sphingosinicella sp. LHD-64]MDQ8757062.1 NAD(P)H-dependent glycerol-3-phosphate dehydrogenase [Sphingosinicella sp. LHD-64]
MRIGVVGAGAWGTALAQIAAGSGGETLIWALEPEVVDSINTSRQNALFLKGLRLAPAIRATGDLADLAGCDAFLVVTPAQHLRAVAGRLPAAGKPLILCAKGIEEGTGLLMHEVARAVQPASPIAVLSGPTFAHEVAAGLPTAVTLAAADKALGEALIARIARPHFRPYYSDDVAGAEVGGAVKNVLAIACGVVEGRGLGLNARAALISRGFAEMTRFGLAKGARAETLAGLAGLGDLVLTCSSTSSRNFSLGKGLGEGARAADLLADRRTVAEGAFTAPVLKRAAAALEVDMPIVNAVCALLQEEASVDEVVGQLLSRPLRSEGV